MERVERKRTESILSEIQLNRMNISRRKNIASHPEKKEPSNKMKQPLRLNLFPMIFKPWEQRVREQRRKGYRYLQDLCEKLRVLRQFDGRRESIDSSLSSLSLGLVRRNQTLSNSPEIDLKLSSRHLPDTSLHRTSTTSSLRKVQCLTSRNHFGANKGRSSTVYKNSVHLTLNNPTFVLNLEELALGKMPE